MVFTTILVVSSFVVSALLIVVVLNLGALALRRAGETGSSLATEMIGVGGPVAVGVIVLWEALGHASGPDGLLPVLPDSLRIGAVLLYLAGCLSYVEVHGLLSRGYSLRILVDLLERGDGASIDSLKAEYGGGLGVRGMVTKRLRTLADLRLLRLQDKQVGPLTPLGKIVAMTASRLRELLRLEIVG
jgi:hypothetical protein